MGSPPRSAVAALSRETQSPDAVQADLISQEIEQLQGIVELSEERIRLLEELQDGLAQGYKLDIPESHHRVLKEQVPLLSEVPMDKFRSPSTSADDYLISKAIVPLDEEVNMIRFMPLRNPRTGAGASSSSGSTQSAMPTALLAAVTSEGMIRLFTPQGDLVLSFSAGHDQPVTHLAVSPSHDEYLIATGDAGGAIRSHKLSVRQRRLSRQEKAARRQSMDEKVSQYMGSTVNVTAQPLKEMQLPQDEDAGSTPRITSLALASSGGNKYVLAGDSEGMVNVFGKNGTLRTRLDSTVPGASVEGLTATPGTAVFRAGREFGFVTLDKLEARILECPNFEGKVQSVTFDAQQSSRLYASDEAGTVWVFSTKNKRECTVDLRFPDGVTSGPLDLAAVKGYGIGLENFGVPGKTVALVALNMSSLSKKSKTAPEVMLPTPEQALVWRKPRVPARAWSLHRRGKEGDLLAFLSEDGREIEIMELLMTVYVAPVSTDLGNFKMPVIAVAIVLVLGYQYMKNKNKGGGGGINLNAGKSSFANSDFAAALRNKKFAGLKNKRF